MKKATIVAVLLVASTVFANSGRKSILSEGPGSGPLCPPGQICLASSVANDQRPAPVLKEGPGSGPLCEPGVPCN
jgi:hypothetical protein